jgi:hypothetical protein
MKEYTKQAIMKVLSELVVEQVKILKADNPVDEDLKFEIFNSSSDILEYGLYDLADSFMFAEKFLENFEAVREELWKNDAGYSENKMNEKIIEIISNT